ncbi:NAD-P-binding protein [Ramaria rubella]|nr:NAD-P-binding protein [Ramaria rubella]
MRSNSSSFNPSRDLPNLEGKVAIVTGGNSGLGYATVQHLAKKGAKVYLATRSKERATSALARLDKEGLEPGNGPVLFLELELSDPRNAKMAAEKVLSLESRLDILVNCAAIVNDLGVIKMTKDGIIETMATNYLGVFVFTQTLLPLLKSTAAAPGSDVRIVNVGSDGHIIHRDTGIKFDSKEAWNNEFKRDLIPSLSRYCYSKLAFQMWSNKLVKLMDAEKCPIEIVILHPGTLFSEGSITALKSLPLSSPIVAIARLFFLQPTKAAHLTSFAAASLEIRENPEKFHGSYLKPKVTLAKSSPTALNDEKQLELWNFTERLLLELGI